MVTRDNKVVTRDNKVVTRDNKVVTRDNKVVTRDNKVVTRDTKVVTRDNKVVTRDNNDFIDNVKDYIFQGMDTSCSLVNYVSLNPGTDLGTTRRNKPFSGPSPHLIQRRINFSEIDNCLICSEPFR